MGFANGFGTEEDLEKVKEDCRTEAPLVEEIGEKNNLDRNKDIFNLTVRS